MSRLTLNTTKGMKKIKIAGLSADPPEGMTKESVEDQTKKYVDRIGELHGILQAEKKKSVLIVLQGMDGSGKDGAVDHVFKECHPSSLNVTSFKKPTEEEFAHDFLWRVHKVAPARGAIQIFVRSHYEDVLIQRVHKWITEDRVDARFDAINAFEKLLETDNHTLILKFFLHISYDQQELELKERMDDPEKYWKHNSSDWKEREHWDEYMRCYEEVLNRSDIPWTVVPVNKRWYRDYVVAKTVAEAMEKLDLAYPALKED